MKTSQVLLVCGFAFCTVASGAFAASAPPPIPAPQSVLPPPTITLAEARAIIDGAIAYARQHNAAMAVMVVDTAGDPIASERMDGVSLTYLQFAEGKAFASAMLRQ